MEGEGNRVAVVGSGLSGLVCARSLRAAGVSVVVFDKARGPGGRMTTRRRDDHRFDHGAQYFTVRHSAFEAHVHAWQGAGIVKPWRARFASWAQGAFSPLEPPRTRWMGAPWMSMIGRHLADGLDVRLSHRVTAIEPKGGGWRLVFEDRAGQGPFRRVIVACPGPQAAALLPGASPIHRVAAALDYAPCWAAMLRFDEPVSLPYDGVHFEDELLGWAARESSKPGRAPGARWVLHASHQWSRAHLEVDDEWVQRAMVNRFRELTGARPVTAVVHRWRYALAHHRAGASALYDPVRGLGLCGDALGAPRVEGAFVSGSTMSALLLGDVGGADTTA